MSKFKAALAFVKSKLAERPVRIGIALALGVVGVTAAPETIDAGIALFDVALNAALILVP